MFRVNYITYEFHFRKAEEALQNACYKKEALDLRALRPVKTR